MSPLIDDLTIADVVRLIEWWEANDAIFNSDRYPLRAILALYLVFEPLGWLDLCAAYERDARAVAVLHNRTLENLGVSADFAWSYDAR